MRHSARPRMRDARGPGCGMPVSPRDHLCSLRRTIMREPRARLGFPPGGARAGGAVHSRAERTTYGERLNEPDEPRVPASQSRCSSAAQWWRPVTRHRPGRAKAEKARSPLHQSGATVKWGTAGGSSADPAPGRAGSPAWRPEPRHPRSTHTCLRCGKASAARTKSTTAPTPALVTQGRGGFPGHRRECVPFEYPTTLTGRRPGRTRRRLTGRPVRRRAPPHSCTPVSATAFT